MGDDGVEVMGDGRDVGKGDAGNGRSISCSASVMFRAIDASYAIVTRTHCKNMMSVSRENRESFDGVYAGRTPLA
jgi:hypothetical protein